MNEENVENITLEEYESKFLYKKNKSNLNIQFNRVAFIFFIVFIISLIYSIQLIHLGSLKSNIKEIVPISSKKNYRADKELLSVELTHADMSTLEGKK